MKLTTSVAANLDQHLNPAIKPLIGKDFTQVADR